MPLQTYKGSLILNGSFSCGSHWLCICPVLAGSACPVPAAPSCPGSRLLWSWGLGPQRPPSKLRTLQKGKGAGLGTQGICTFPHLLDSRQALWARQMQVSPWLPRCQEPRLCGPAVVAATVLAGAVSAPVSWACPRAVEKLTPSLRLQA